MTVLETGNMTSYPDTCSKATAAFAVLSETIKAIQEVLLLQHVQSSSSSRKEDLVQLISQLQGHEKQKLHLTAAHHLERIRHRNQNLLRITAAGSSPSSDARIEQLLQQGVQSLQQQIHACVEQINEVLDEIRCTVMEEEDE